MLPVNTITFKVTISEEFKYQSDIFRDMVLNIIHVECMDVDFHNPYTVRIFWTGVTLEPPYI